jgi:hypothetical protein
MTAPHPDDARLALTLIGERRSAAARELQACAIDLGDAATRAHGVLTVAEMARLAGVSRVTVYEAMRARGGDEQ